MPSPHSLLSQGVGVDGDPLQDDVCQGAILLAHGHALHGIQHLKAIDNPDI